MPEYDHACQNEECKHEWSDTYSIKQDPPKDCPKCGQATAKRLISGGSGRGIVELYGDDLVKKVKADAQQLKRDAAKDERTYANLLGETKYQDLQTRMDRQRR
jgi:putative FmdB family regulatory protein